LVIRRPIENLLGFFKKKEGIGEKAEERRKANNFGVICEAISRTEEI